MDRLHGFFSRSLGVLVLVVGLMPLCAQATLVRIQTVRGPLDIALTDSATPKTVANFLSYVRANAYDGSFFHRHAAGFVLQGGGYTFPPLVKITAGPAVVNEFSVNRPNVRGTIAMAKLGGNANSATTEWFFNLVDNTVTLGATNNSGFTVFGTVTQPGLAVLDVIAALPVVDAGGTFNTLPTINPPTSGPLTKANLVIVTSVRELPTTLANDSDRTFNYLEAAYSQFISPASAASMTGGGYYFRYYAATNSYVGTKEGKIYYLVPALSADIQLLGDLATWLGVAVSQGY